MFSNMNENISMYIWLIQSNYMYSHVWQDREKLTDEKTGDNTLVTLSL